MRRLAIQTLITVVFVMLTASAALCADDTETVKTAVKETQGRSGPGSFYELVVLIPQGTVLTVQEKQKSWYKVTYNKQTIWVSVNSLAIEAETESQPAPQAPADPFASLSSESVSVRASPATLTAAIKGFWTRYTRTQGELTELPVDGFDIDIAAYESFTANRARTVNRDRLESQFRLGTRPPRNSLTYEKEHSIGYAIASSIADAPLIDDPALVQYVHEVGWYIAESTERYDIEFIFYILDTDRINAVSCPGGYVVLTRGLLKLLNDEAELAALLAHEMSHVIAGHAMQSMEESEVSMRADSAFDMLNRETSTAEAEQDLIGITNRAVSIATSPKLDEQEFEADENALRYLARSGYDLGGLSRMLMTMMAHHERQIDIFDLNYRNHPDFDERLTRIERELRDYSRYDGQAFRSEFARRMSR